MNLQVVDLTSGIPGGYCAKLLGDAGADVVKVETPVGDPLRRWSNRPDGAPPADEAGGALFRYLHHGHRSIVVDPHDRPSAELDADLDRLLAGADIVLLDTGRDHADAHTLAARFPALVVASITPFGLEGPYAGRPATELTLQAESGALAIRGGRDRPPVQAGGRTFEWVSGLYAAVAALASVRLVRAGGPGELIDLSMAEVANTTATIGSDLMDSLRGRPELTAPPRSLETPSIEPTADGYVGFNTNTRQQLDSFLVLIERPDLVEGGEWASPLTRAARFAEWESIVHSWTTRHTSAEIIARAAELRIPVAPVADAPAILELEQATARGVFVDDPTGSFTMPRRPWRIHGEELPSVRPAPRLGEHTGTVEPAPAMPAPAVPARLPLAGLRVLDLTAWWAGPSASGMLAALGADVIHLESISHLDGIRLAVGANADRDQWWEYSALFLTVNANKRDLTLDMRDPRGRELALELVACSDLVVENYTPRVMGHFGLTWDVVHATNPRAVMVRMPAFGLDGPWRDRPGFAQTMEQVTGLAWLTGHVDDQPRIQRGPCDPNGGLHAMIGALAALARRDETGEGCLVEAPMFEAALNISAELVIEWTASGTALAREGNRSPWAAPQGVYATNVPEQWLVLSVATDAQWCALVDVLGAPGWASDERLASHHGRRAHHDLLDEHLTTWAAGLALDDALGRLLAAGVPAAPAVDPRRTSGHPQFTARGYYETVDHPVVGRHPMTAPPFRFRSVDHWLRTPAPTLGQHNHEILRELGLDDPAIRALEDAGIVGNRPAGL